MRQSHQCSFDTHLDGDAVVEAAKYISSVKYRVNSEVLAFMTENVNHWQTSAYPDFDSLKQYTETTARRKFFEHFQKHMDEVIILNVAHLMKNVPYFYFDVFVDWRGRFYINSDYLNYQGNKLALGLIEFYEGKPVDALGLQAFYKYGESLKIMKNNEAFVRDLPDLLQKEILSLRVFPVVVA